MEYIQVDSVTRTSMTCHLYEIEGLIYDQTVTLYQSDGATVVESKTTPSSGSSSLTFTGLTPNTTYVVKWIGSTAEPQTFTTPTDDPKVATESQWEDLANRVKAKADSSSLATVATSGSYADLSNKPTIPTGAGTRRATSTGWNTSTPLDYIKGSASYSHEGQTRLIAGELFPTAKNLSDFPVYAGIGIYAPEAGAEYTPYLLTQQVSDDGTGTTSGNAGAHRIALHSEIPRITMQTTDPGEGATLAANSFIAVYSA